MYAIYVHERAENGGAGKLVDLIVRESMAEAHRAACRQYGFKKRVFKPGDLPLSTIAELYENLDTRERFFERVNTLELRQGDIVVHTLGLIHLGERLISEAHNDVKDDGGWCEYGPDDELLWAWPSCISTSTRKYNIQGNGLANWIRFKRT